MLTVISPAKTLDFETPPLTRRATQPRLTASSADLVADARKMNAKKIRSLMGVSDAIAQLNHQRFQDWSLPFTLDNAKQALFAFRGDVYTGLDADTLTAADRQFAQHHLRILSGLYGLLRPLDLIQPYRLEMGLKFNNRGGKDLYEFWGDTIAREVNQDLKKSGSRVLVNLASNEYFRAIDAKALNADVLTPVFKDLKGDNYKVISFFAKKARGQMTRFIIENEINDAAVIKKFRVAGYRYSAAASREGETVFLRDKPPA
ncbi:MAG: peroxide stress protein YaaA [Pseudomonadota bacterium]